MITMEAADRLTNLLRVSIVALVRRDGRDLSARQLGVFLTCYLDSEAQTVRGLAAKLNIAKSTVSRVLDRLAGFDLVRRKTDPKNRRSVLIRRTATGMVFLREMRTILHDAASALESPAEPVQADQTATRKTASTTSYSVAGNFNGA